MKKAVCLVVWIVFVFLCGCSWQLPDVNDPSYKYLYQETETVGEAAVQVTSSEAEESDTVVTVPSNPETTVPVYEENSTEGYTQEVPDEQDTTIAYEPSTEATETTTRVSLDISMPEKNGAMYTDSSSQNRFIEIVNKEKGIDKRLLVAVYSMPDTGQNYVFEFYTEKERTADQLRRVYLIDSSGSIVSVSATDSSERVGMGTIENWFSMNVLIKELIFPAISESIN